MCTNLMKWTFCFPKVSDVLRFNPLYQLSLVMESSYSSGNSHDIDGGVGAESPVTEVCVYTGRLCGF